MCKPSWSLAIRSAHLERGLTQEQLAARLGVSQGTVSFWESGAEVPTVEHLIALGLELPRVLDAFEGREKELLRRLRLERRVFAGRCACPGCSCQPEAAP